MDGKGIYFDDGKIYEGEFKNSKYDGRGTICCLSDGKKCIGEFKNGKMHGYCTLIDGDTIKTGEWIEGVYEN
jgi:hypothetical protein